MAVVDYALTTRQKVKDLLGITDTSDDAVIDALIDGITDFIQSYTGGRNFLAQDYVELKDTYYSPDLFFNQIPVNSVAKIEYRTGVPSAPVWVTYNANSYLVYTGLRAKVHFFAKFNPVPMAFRFSYNAGYLIDWSNEHDKTKHTLPYDLTRVATELCSKAYNMRYAHGISREQTEGQMLIYEGGKNILNDDHAAILNKYKMNRVAP